INDLGLVDLAEAVLLNPQDNPFDQEAYDEAHGAFMKNKFGDEANDDEANDDEAKSPYARSEDDDMERVLGAVRPFLAPSIVADIERELIPIVRAAHKLP